MLESLELFEGVNPYLITEIEQRAIRKEAPEGTVFFVEGEVSDGMFVILDGSVEVFRNKNGERFLVSILQEGDCFGETAMVMNTPRSATVIADTDTEVLEISRALFNEIFGVDPEISAKISQKLTSRVRENLTF